MQPSPQLPELFTSIHSSSASPVAPHNNPYFHELARSVTTLAAHINAAECEWLMLVAEFDRLEAWKIDPGIGSTTNWLAWKCRLGKGTAREKVRVARALEHLPKIRSAFASGELSYSVVRELTRVASTMRETLLLNICRHATASHVERLVRHVRHIDSQADPKASLENSIRRRASWCTREDGMIEIRAVLAPDQGQKVTRALDSLVDQIKADAVSESEGYVDIAQARADAVERLAEVALGASSGEALSGGELTTMHVDIDQLVGSAENDGGKDIPRGTLSRLSCDCAVVASLNDASGKCLSIGRKTRVVPPALRKALVRRDHGCTFPGCSNHRYVDAHHIVHWARGGETSVSNLTLLCRRHHRLVHEGGFEVKMSENGRPLFFSAWGRWINPAPVVDVPAGTLPAHNSRRGINIDHTTTHPHWDGQPLDWGSIVSAVVIKEPAVAVPDRPRTAN